MTFNQAVPKSLIIYASCLAALLLTAFTYLVLKNAFFDGPKVSLAGYELGIEDTNVKIHAHWWTVPHKYSQEEWADCYKDVSKGLKTLDYVQRHNISAGWLFVALDKEIALIYCENSLARIVVASADNSRGKVMLNTLRDDLIRKLREYGSLDETGIAQRK